MCSLHQIKEFVKTSFYNTSENKFSSILEMLWYSYTKHNPVENNELKIKIDELEPVIGPLSQKRKCMLRRLISEIMVEQEHASFISGMQAGAQLMVELYERNDGNAGEGR